MKGMWAIAAATAALALAGCATTSEDPNLAGPCKAEPGQRFVGQRATAEVGAELMRVTHAEILRWGPPNSAMTMDFRTERLTVAYDNNMVITMVTCG